MLESVLSVDKSDFKMLKSNFFLESLNHNFMNEDFIILTLVNGLKLNQ